MHKHTHLLADLHVTASKKESVRKGGKNNFSLSVFLKDLKMVDGERARSFLSH